MHKYKYEEVKLKNRSHDEQFYWESVNKSEWFVFRMIENAYLHKEKTGGSKR